MWRRNNGRKGNYFTVTKAGLDETLALDAEAKAKWGLGQLALAQHDRHWHDFSTLVSGVMIPRARKRKSDFLFVDLNFFLASNLCYTHLTIK